MFQIPTIQFQGKVWGREGMWQKKRGKVGEEERKRGKVGEEERMLSKA